MGGIKSKISRFFNEFMEGIKSKLSRIFNETKNDKKFPETDAQKKHRAENFPAYYFQVIDQRKNLIEL